MITEDELEVLRINLITAEENAKYYKSEYELSCSAIRRKNKEIAELKRKITKLENTIIELQKQNDDEIETLF